MDGVSRAEEFVLRRPVTREYTLAVAHQGHKLTTINEEAAGNEHAEPYLYTSPPEVATLRAWVDLNENVAKVRKYIEGSIITRETRKEALAALERVLESTLGPCKDTAATLKKLQEALHTEADVQLHEEPAKPQRPLVVGDRVRDLFGRHAEGWVVSTFSTTSGRTLHGVELDDGTVLIFPAGEVDKIPILHQFSEMRESLLVCERCGCSENAIRYFGWWECNPKRLVRRKEGPYLAGRPS